MTDSILHFSLRSLVILLIGSCACLGTTNNLQAAENELGLSYSFRFAQPKPEEPTPPPLTIQDQVHYCAVAEEWSKKVWEMTDGSHHIYSVHFYHGSPAYTGSIWHRWPGTPRATRHNTGSIMMYDMLKVCQKVFSTDAGELTGHLTCAEEGQVCSSDNIQDYREAFCTLDGEPVPATVEEMAWALAHESGHANYGAYDEYNDNLPGDVGNVNFPVCFGRPDNQGTEETSMMAARGLNHWCDGGTHVSEREVRGADDNVLVDSNGNPFIQSSTSTVELENNTSPSAWEYADKGLWEIHPLNYSGYDDIPPYPGLPVMDPETGDPIEFCNWHFTGDGQPVNDALVLLDKSGSMGFQHPAFEDGPTALEAASQSAASFHNAVRDDRLVGVLAFDSSVTEVVPYGPKEEEIEAPELVEGGSTDLCAAIREGADAIKAVAPTTDFGPGQQILLSDGRPTTIGCESDAEVLAAALDACLGGVNGLGVATNTIAFGDADRELLRQVADVCGAESTALMVATSPLMIEGEIEHRSTPLQIRTALSRSGQMARNYDEILHRSSHVASPRDDEFIVAPGTSEVMVEWMGDGFRHLSAGDFEGILCTFNTLNYQLIAPDGDVIENSEIPVEGEQSYLTKTIRIASPEPGLWRARITPQDVFVCFPDSETLHDWGDYDPQIAVVASVINDRFTPDMQVSPAVAPRDTPIAITASIYVSESAQITGLNASARVFSENGGVTVVPLFDDGNHEDETAEDGIYTGVFNNDRDELDPGGYRVALRLSADETAAHAVHAGDGALQGGAGPLPSIPDLRFSLEDSFVYRDCEQGNSLSGNTCDDRVALPTDPSPGDACTIDLRPGEKRANIEVATHGLALGKEGVLVSLGVSVEINNVETVNYNHLTREGLVRFDARAYPRAPDRPRHVRVAFAKQSVTSKGCKATGKKVFEYAAKMVCGVQQDTRNMQLARGFYGTTINIRNPQFEPITISKSLSLAIPPGGQIPGKVLPISRDALLPQQTLAADCDDVAKRLFDGKLPAPFIDGFLVIQSPVSLDVSAVYTTATLNAEGTVENHSSIAVESIRERRIKRKRQPRGRPDLVVRDIDIDSIRIDCVSTDDQSSCRTEVDVTVANVGATAAGPFSVRTELDPNQSVIVEDDVPTGLASGESTTLTINAQSSESCFDPECTICAFADHKSEINESDESNNMLCRSR